MSARIQNSLQTSANRRRFGAMCAALCATTLLSITATPSHAQSLSLSGSLWIHQPSARPLPAVGYKVYLYSKQSGWSRPSYTDSAGRYAHYGVRPDKYLLQIRDSQNKTVWQQDVTVNNNSVAQVPWIVLPRA
jgi:Carboxypeptidase regulatory-like domain